MQPYGIEPNRVSLQALTDWHPLFFGVVGVSGILELAGLAWWGTHLIGVMCRGRLVAVRPAVEHALAACAAGVAHQSLGCAPRGPSSPEMKGPSMCSRGKVVASSGSSDTISVRGSVVSALSESAMRWRRTKPS